MKLNLTGRSTNSNKKWQENKQVWDELWYNAEKRWDFWMQITIHEPLRQ